MEKKYGREGARERIYVTCDASGGLLRQIALKEGYEIFNIPGDVGGRFSVLTPVGLLPIAAAGLDTGALLAGAADAAGEYARPGFDLNICWQYAALRNVLYNQGKTNEVLISYETCFNYFGEWWKQLYGESEGKEQKGIYPSTALFSTDLHSLGQYIQDGIRNLFETLVMFKSPVNDVEIPFVENDEDGLNFLAGKTLDYVNSNARAGTLLAHLDGGVPNLIIEAGKLDAYNLGGLIYLFERACGLSGYVLGVNPFDQPGVEAYKRNMFALLGKKGYESERERLMGRLR
jgi:glucose-6-phosphate isomerase